MGLSEMGVRRLRKHLESYGEDIVIGRADPDAAEKRSPRNGNIAKPKHFRSRLPVVIDGPCLAYFIYNRVLAQQDPDLGEVDRIPSYALVNQAVLAFLNLLEKHEIQMYFA